MIEYKLVNAIANVESKSGDGSQGGGGSDGGTTNDLKLAVQFTLFADDSLTHTGVDLLEEDGTYLFKLATSNFETIAKGSIKFYGSETTLQKPKTEFEYIPGQSGSGDFKLTCKTSAIFSELTFELLSLTRVEKMHYDNQADSEEDTRMYFYNISDQTMTSPITIIELATLSLNVILFK